MITSYSDIYSRLENTKPVRLAVINPQSNYLKTTLGKASKLGWIEPISFFKNDYENPSKVAVDSVKNGECQLLMKGDVDTATLLKAVLDSETGIKTNNLLSHIAVVESPQYHKLLFITDGGVNTHLDEQTIDSILENSIELCSTFQIEQSKIALLTLVEKVTSKLPETELADVVCKKYKNQTEFMMEGPIALDVAVSKDASVKKGIDSKISGETDIIIGPSISASNMIVKTLMSLGGAKGGCIILGAKCPIVLLSRSDLIDTKLNSIALSLMMLKRGKNGY